MKPCLSCEELTGSECVCGHAYCYECRELLRAALCPMCVRIAAIRQEYAMLKRVVPWQMVDKPLFLGSVDLSEQTEPIESLKVKGW